jgi:hypothetical protein
VLDLLRPPGYDPPVQTSVKILIVGGVLSLATAYVLGFLMTNLRLRNPGVPQTLLLQAHRDALWQGFMLLGLAWAATLSNLGNGIEIVAALLIVAAAVLSVGSTIANWRMNVADQFAAGPKALGYYLAAINATLVSIGLLIFIIGVFKGL